MINLESINDLENLQKRAQKTLSVMDDILEEVRDKKNLDLLNVLNFDDKKELSFKERSYLNFVSQKYGRIKWYYEDIKKCSEGKFIMK